MDKNQIKGLDWEIGSKAVNGDEELFLEVLKTYYEESQDILDKYKAYQGEDLERTIIDMHGMKSASAGIGAMELSAEFKAMELEGKTGNADYLLNNMAGCLKHLEELCADLKAFLDEAVQEKGNDLSDKPEESLSEAVLDELIQALEDIEFEMFEEKIAELKQNNYGAVINEGISKADRAYDNFDYDDAKDALVELKGML